MFDYKPEIYTEYVHDPDIGWLAAAFEPFKPNPDFSWEAGKREKVSFAHWKIQKAKSAPPIPKKPEIIKNMMKMIWTFAEPAKGATRGDVIIGARAGVDSNHKPLPVVPAFKPSPTYNPQVRPTAPTGGAITTFWDDQGAIATDWKMFRHIERVNAVTFRGDTRPPIVVISQCGGFNPPNTRTDRYFIENNVYTGFADYLKRRYGLQLDQQKFLRAIDSAVPSPEDKKLLIDYMAWRQITERESAHLGRMVDQELLKGYISTTPSIDTAINFGTKYNTQPGWVYITVVHGAFVVPYTPNKSIVWGSGEGEVAQLGWVPAERIVGFARLKGNYGPPVGPFFIRPEFRKKEPKAFQYLFNALSGKTKG